MKFPDFLCIRLGCRGFVDVFYDFSRFFDLFCAVGDGRASGEGWFILKKSVGPQIGTDFH